MPPPPARPLRPEEYTSWARDGWMLADGGVVMLMYHKIAPTPAATNWRGLYVEPRGFARQMAGFAEAGVPGVPYGENLAAIAAGRSGFCLSFDDGFANVFDHALPTLQARGLRAMQFLVAGQIGGEDEWDRAIGEPPQALMDDAQIRDWLSAGHEIGAHTLTHPHLTAIPRAQARAEVFDSKKLLEDRFGVPVRHFCYPYGDYNEATRDLVAEAGYESAPTTRFGVNRPGVPPLELRRVIACNRPSSLQALKRHAVRAARGLLTRPQP